MMLVLTFAPEYLNEEMSLTCDLCQERFYDGDLYLNAPNYGMPLSLAAHWIQSSSIECSFTRYNLDSMASMRAHYVRIPNPGDSFNALEHFLQEHRVFLRRQQQEVLENCRQS